MAPNPGPAYHKNVWLSFILQGLFNLTYNIAFGPLFDVYLFQIAAEGQGNILVGKVESVNGLVALALVIPVGIIVDKWDRLKLMRFSGLIGLCCSVVGACAIHYRSIPFWYATMVFNGIYGELGNSVCYALFADSIVNHQRTRATSTIGIISNVAQAIGPLATFVSMLYIGNTWTTEGLEKVLMFGIVVVNTLCCVPMFFFVKAPFQQDADEVDASPAAEENAELMKIKGARAVPWIVSMADLVTCIGAGMTIKYFNLYWKNTWHMSPTNVLAIAAVQPLVVALFTKLIEKPAEKFGRVQAVTISRVFGAAVFLVLASASNLPLALTVYFVRSGMANAVFPLNKSIMFDFTPSNQRGRWNAVATLSGSVWSGSAFIGGYVSDAHGYAFTFLFTAGIYAFACLVYAPLLCIVPRKQTGPSSASTPFLANPADMKERMQSPGPAQQALVAKIATPQRSAQYKTMPEDS